MCSCPYLYTLPSIAYAGNGRPCNHSVCRRYLTKDESHSLSSLFQILIVMHLGLTVKATTFGLGRHADHLTSENFLLSVKWVLIAAPFGIIGVAVPKLAVVIFLARVVGPTKHNQIRVLYFFVITLNILTALAAMLVFIQCSPPYAPWTPSVPHTCWNPAIVKHSSFFVAGTYRPYKSTSNHSLIHLQHTQLSTTWSSEFSPSV